MQDNDWAHLQRSWDFLSPLDLKTAATIVGCGSVGSVAAMTLLKMGVPAVVIYDEDVINPENLPNQFLPDNIGEMKVNGLLDILALMGLGEKAIPQPHMWLGERLNAEIVISAVDSMAVRRQLFSACVREGTTRLFIDARTGGEYMKVYALNPGNERMKCNYLATLHSDDSADNVPCTASQIIYTSLFAGGMIAHRVKQWIKSEEITFDTIFDIQHEVVVPSRRLWKRE